MRKKIASVWGQAEDRCPRFRHSRIVSDPEQPDRDRRDFLAVVPTKLPNAFQDMLDRE